MGQLRGPVRALRWGRLLGTLFEHVGVCLSWWVCLFVSVSRIRVLPPGCVHVVSAHPLPTRWMNTWYFSGTAAMELLWFESLYVWKPLRPLPLTDHEAGLHLSQRNFQHHLNRLPPPFPPLSPPHLHHPPAPITLCRDILPQSLQVLLPLTWPPNHSIVTTTHSVPSPMSGPECTRMNQILSLPSRSSESTRRDRGINK